MTEISGSTVAAHGSEGRLKSAMTKLKDVREKYRHRHDPKPGSVQIDRGTLVKEETTHKKLSERGKRREGTESEKVVVNPELLKEYGNFLTGYVRNLNRLSTEEGQILDHPSFRHERDIMGMLSTHGMPDANKIKMFLESHQGIALTTQILEEQTALMVFALGLDAAPRFGGHGALSRDFDQRMDPMLVNVGRSGIKRERLGRLAHMFGTDTVGYGRGLGGAAMGAGVGVMASLGIRAGLPQDAYASVRHFIADSVGNAASPMVLGPLGAAAGLGVARRFFLPDGDVDFTACGEGLRILQNDPRLGTYLHEMTGVDPNDFMVVGDQIQRNPNQPYMETGSIQDIKRQIIQNIQTRRSFYEALGYPTTRPGRAPEQLFTNHNIDSRKQWATIWQDKIDKRLDRNGAAFLAMTPQQQREAYMNARRDVMREYLQDYRDKVLHGEDLSGAESELQAKRRQLQETDRQTHVDRHTELSRRAKDDREYLEGVQKDIYGDKPVPEGGVTLAQAQDELKSARQRLADINPALTRADIEASEIPALVREKSDIATRKEDLLSALETEQNEVRTGLTTGGTLKDLSRYVKHVTNKTGVVTVPMTLDEIYSVLQSNYETQSARYDAQIRDLDNRIGNLRSIGAEIDAKQKQADKLSAVEGSTYPQESREAFDNILEATRTSRHPITEAELADPSVTIDSLLERINASHRVAHSGRDNQPWTESENARNELRHRLLNARIEARVRQAMHGFMPAAELSFQVLSRWGGLPTLIPEGKLASMTSADVLSQLNELHANNPALFPDPSAVTTTAAIDLAIEAAKARAMFRKDELKQMIGGLTRTEQLEEWLKDHYEVSEDAQRVEVALNLVHRQGEILENSTDPTKLRMVDIVCPDVARTADTDLNDREKATIRQVGGVPRGYYRFMDYLFEHKSGPDGNAEFGRIQSLLSPRQFFDILHEGLDTGELILDGVGLPGDIRDLFAQMQASYQAGNLNERTIRSLSSYIIDHAIEVGRNVR